MTGWHRDHARKAIRRRWPTGAGGPPPRAPREPVRSYDDAAVALLTRCWAVLDGPTGKRLHAGLPEVLANLARHGHLQAPIRAAIDQVLAMSPATIDRRLAPARTGLVARKPIAHTRPGSMLKASIPMKTWPEWNDHEPGFIQIDLVGHEGGDNNGAVLLHPGRHRRRHRLDRGDHRAVQGRTDRRRRPGDQLRLRFPFHIAGIHSDNGSEFINHHLARWCQTRQITFTRGRSSHKNDQAHVEQKNWSVVRRSVGYFRYDTRRELDLLNQLWPLTSLQVNLFLPQQTPDHQDPHRRDRPQDPRHRRHPTDADCSTTPRRTSTPTTADTSRPNSHDHRPPRPAPPDHRHPSQPHRTRPPTRHRSNTRAKTNATYLSRRKMTPHHAGKTR